MKKTIFAYLAVCLAFVVSCSKESSITEQTNPTQTESFDALKVGVPKMFLIKKGAHYSKPDPFSFTNKLSLNFSAVFDSSCIYSTIDAANQADINKLYGFSDCGDQHLTNSARVGWRWSNDSLRIFAFVHFNEQMLWKEITTAAIGSEINCGIECIDGSYIFTVNGKTVEMPRACSGKNQRYKLNPYFGGDEAATHDIRIQITEK